MIVAIRGGLTCDNRAVIFRILDGLRPSRIIHDGRDGAARFALEWAKSRGVNDTEVQAYATKLGRDAELVRNGDIAALQPNVVIVIREDGDDEVAADMMLEARGIEAAIVSLELPTDFTVHV